MIDDGLTIDEMKEIFKQICKMSGQQLRQVKSWVDHESRLAAEEAELEYDRAVARAMAEAEAEVARMKAEVEALGKLDEEVK